jgi:hypothetical protein
MVAIFAGLTIPITAPQILWVNMVTSVALVSTPPCVSVAE